MSDFPQYKDIYEKYHKREKEILDYKNKCLGKGLEMFVKYFNDLWW